MLAGMETHHPADLPEGLRRLYYIMGQDQAEDRAACRRETAAMLAATGESLERSRAVLKRLGEPASAERAEDAPSRHLERLPSRSVLMTGSVLEMCRRHVAEGKVRLIRQKLLIARLTALDGGPALHAAEAFLREMLEFQ